MLAGQIVALKGLGGFQLLVDATNAEAVARLRQRKRRPDRPFALMLPSLDDVRRYCEVSEEEARALCSHQAPIVLLRRSAAECGSNLVCPGSPDPCSPALSPLPVDRRRPRQSVPRRHAALHAAASSADGGRRAADRLHQRQSLGRADGHRPPRTRCERLGPIADVLLTHDRPIVRPGRRFDRPRRARRRCRCFAVPGDSPRCRSSCTVDVADAPTILAVGGHLKNTVALLLGRRCVKHSTERIAGGQRPAVTHRCTGRHRAPTSAIWTAC